MDKLKPCPHCGGKAKLSVCRHGSKAFDYCEVICGKCNASVRYDIDVEYSAKDKSIETWNRRAEEC
jgi:Lar family restriction alleviation protein